MGPHVDPADLAGQARLGAHGHRPHSQLDYDVLADWMVLLRLHPHPVRPQRYALGAGRRLAKDIPIQQHDHPRRRAVEVHQSLLDLASNRKGAGLLAERTLLNCRVRGPSTTGPSTEPQTLADQALRGRWQHFEQLVFGADANAL